MLEGKIYQFNDLEAKLLPNEVLMDIYMFALTLVYWILNQCDGSLVVPIYSGWQLKQVLEFEI